MSMNVESISADVALINRDDPVIKADAFLENKKAKNWTMNSSFGRYYYEIEIEDEALIQSLDTMWTKTHAALEAKHGSIENLNICYSTLKVSFTLDGKRQTVRVVELGDEFEALVKDIRKLSKKIIGKFYTKSDASKDNAPIIQPLTISTPYWQKVHPNNKESFEKFLEKFPNQEIDVSRFDVVDQKIEGLSNALKSKLNDLDDQERKTPELKEDKNFVALKKKVRKIHHEIENIDRFALYVSYGLSGLNENRQSIVEKTNTWIYKSILSSLQNIKKEEAGYFAKFTSYLSSCENENPEDQKSMIRHYSLDVCDLLFDYETQVRPMHQEVGQVDERVTLTHAIMHLISSQEDKRFEECADWLGEKQLTDVFKGERNG